jgi:hypothetical protein
MVYYHHALSTVKRACFGAATGNCTEWDARALA